MARRLAAVASRIDGRLQGADAGFGAVSIDTRSMPAGALFVAIKGERFDGNDFVATAAERGAAGALVSRLQDLALPQIEVDDTRRAFADMAVAWRENFDVPVVAITGSAGKTTVRELTASILSIGRKICVTQGNLNNDIGVPLSLMRLESSDAAMVVELGANHAGEIAHLGRLVEPTVAVITNAGAAHLEGFGSIAGVAKAKGELLDCLPDNGTAVLNYDDPYFGEWVRRSAGRRVVSFGFDSGADYHLEGELTRHEGQTCFELGMPDGERIEIRLGLLGRANVANALAAAAAASAAGATAEEIRQGLENAKAVRGRMNRLRGVGGATLIDDSYNANPSAARAALDFLASLPGTRILVLGDMLELGSEARAMHREVGEYARARCDELVTIGDLARAAAEAFGNAATSFSDIDAAAAFLRERLDADVTVLVKASRSIGLERLVQQLNESGEGVPC